MMNDSAAAIRDGTNNFVPVGRPIGSFDKVQLALDTRRPIGDQQFAVLIHPALTTE